MIFSDIHIHALYGVDDGSKTEQDMWKMLEASYKDGVRYICLTPHFHPGYFGEHHTERDTHYQKLLQAVSKRYPDLQISLGNELRYADNSMSWLEHGDCRTLNETDYLLVDFYENEDAKNIQRGLKKLLNAGYIPVLAHAERYRKLNRNHLAAFQADGVCIQVDTQSVLGDFGLGAKMRSREMLKRRQVNFIGSDAHDLKQRPPQVSRCYQSIVKLCGEEYAAAVCGENARQVIFNKRS